MLLLNGADRDAEAVRDLPVRKELNLPEEKDRAAALGQLRDRMLEDVQLLPGDHLRLDARGLGRRRLGEELLAGDGRDAAALQTVDRKAPGRGVEQTLRVLGLP